MDRLEYFAIPLDIKALGERQFSGHGAIFGNVDLDGDIVVPGAFKRSLAKYRDAGTMPAMFWMHQPDQVPGAWDKVVEDDEGLATVGELATTQLGEDLRKLMKLKAVRGQSIGYRPIEVDWDKQGNRLLKEVDLWEISIVSLAMNPLARVEAVKARLSELGEYVPSAREMEAYFSKMGCSRKAARSLVAKLFDGHLRDADDSLRDAGLPDSDATAAIKAANELADRMQADMLLHQFT